MNWCLKYAFYGTAIISSPRSSFSFTFIVGLRDFLGQFCTHHASNHAKQLRFVLSNLDLSRTHTPRTRQGMESLENCYKKYSQIYICQSGLHTTRATLIAPRILLKAALVTNAPIFELVGRKSILGRNWLPLSTKRHYYFLFHPALSVELSSTIPSQRQKQQCAE